MVNNRATVDSFELDGPATNNPANPYPKLDDLIVDEIDLHHLTNQRIQPETAGRGIEFQGEKEPRKLTRKDYLLVGSFAYINVITGAVYSCLAPFFPREAEEKGLSPSVYGFLFAIQEIISFVLCPVVGILLPKLGLRPTLLYGSVIASIGVFSFGGVNWAPPGLPFAIACGATRGFGSIGMAGLVAGLYAAIPIFFADHVPQVFGLLEMCYSLGMIIGPLLGGFLYESGGFDLPFFVCGALMTLSFPLVYYLCPESKNTKETKTKVGIFDILSNYRILINIIVTLVVLTIFGFSEMALEPHLRDFANLRSSTVGIIFLVGGLFYGLATWVVGMLMPKVKDATHMSIVGLTLVILSYIFIGPMYPLPISPSVTLVVICQMLFGIGSSICLVSNFTQAMKERDLSDLKEDPGSGSLISSLFVSIFSLGTAIGPVAGGQLIEIFTFEEVCLFIVALVALVLIVVILTIIFHRRPIPETLVTPKVIVQRLASTQHSVVQQVKSPGAQAQSQSGQTPTPNKY